MNGISKLYGKKKGRRARKKAQELDIELGRAGEESNTGDRSSQETTNGLEDVDGRVHQVKNANGGYSPVTLTIRRADNLPEVLERLFQGTRMALINAEQKAKLAAPRQSRGFLTLPPWQQDIIVRSQTTRECLFEFFTTVPALLYSLTALVPLIELPDINIRHGFRIANGVLLCLLIFLGYWGERFTSENRWYPRHYFLWTLLCNFLMWISGYYPDDFEETGRRIQAVQMLVFWCVELVDRGKLERLRREEV